MLKDLPLSLLKSAQNILEDKKVCKKCFGVGCPRCGQKKMLTAEDELSAMDVPTDEEPEEELSGEREEVIINPTYLTFRSRLPY